MDGRMNGCKDDCATDGLERPESESLQNPPHGILTEKKGSGSRVPKFDARRGSPGGGFIRGVACHLPTLAVPV